MITGDVGRGGDGGRGGQPHSGVGSRGTVTMAFGGGDDPAEAVSRITSPADGALMKANVLRIKGVAAAPASISRVEVSPDNGTNWYEASGKTVWYHDWTVTGDGNHTLLSRVIDDDGRIETPGPGVTITIDSTLPTTSGALAADEEWRRGIDPGRAPSESR